MYKRRKTMHGNYGVFDVIMQYCSSILFAAGQGVSEYLPWVVCIHVCVCMRDYLCTCMSSELWASCVQDKLSMVWCHTFLDSYYTHLDLKALAIESCRVWTMTRRCSYLLVRDKKLYEAIFDIINENRIWNIIHPNFRYM